MTSSFELRGVGMRYGATKPPARIDRRLASDIFAVPGPHIAEAAEAFESMLHPEANR